MPEILTLTFESMAHGGQALARAPDGRVVFVSYAIPGETARVELVEADRGFARGRVVELLAASPHRVEPRCPHFPQSPAVSLRLSAEDLGAGRWCGGCQWQHIAYPSQLEYKTQIVRDQFSRVGKLPDAPVAPTLAAEPWHYRNHMQFAVNADGALCLQAPESHDLVTIRVCYIMDVPIAGLFESVELEPQSFSGVTLRAGENTGDRFIILESDDGEVPELETDETVSIAFRSGGLTLPILGKETLTERVGARTFSISPDSFFQVNTAQAETLLRLVTGFLEPRPTDVLLDAYGGVGLFGLSLASQVARVIEVEENPGALEDARDNAGEWDGTPGLTNVEFHAGAVERVLPSLPGPLDLVVVDPPRAGLGRVALEAIAARGPRAIAYVSCDPATLARDAARFLEHHYRLTHVQPVDLFPQTYHIECVARLVRD